VPSEKRARKRAAREQKLAALARQRRRRRLMRRGALIAAAVAVIAVVIAVTTSGGGAKSSTTASKASTTTKATTSASTTTTLLDSAAAPTTTSTTSVNLAGVTTSARCPTPFTATTKLDKPSWPSPPPMTINVAKTYTATVTTDVGSFVIALDAKQAPVTVNSFVFLAENHFYDCVVFHRVIQGFMDQTGDPTGTGTGGPGYQFKDENLPKSSSAYKKGVVAMANSGPNTNGSQFFIMAANYPLPPSYSIFGHVTSGMSVVKKINQGGSNPKTDPSGTGTPTVLHRIISVAIHES
jgi:cyclophilin family peptidyl-prolyl cis-trans isomerase